MNAEIPFFGLFLPSFLVCALVAYVVTAAVVRLLEGLGLYDVVWHGALFNFSLFVCMVGASLLLASRVTL
jgi:hypothetical protein